MTRNKKNNSCDREEEEFPPILSSPLRLDPAHGSLLLGGAHRRIRNAQLG